MLYAVAGFAMGMILDGPALVFWCGFVTGYLVSAVITLHQMQKFAADAGA